MTEQCAYQEGCEARKRGDEYHRCPYGVFHEDLKRSWKQGWNAADHKICNRITYTMTCDINEAKNSIRDFQWHDDPEYLVNALTYMVLVLDELTKKS